MEKVTMISFTFLIKITFSLKSVRARIQITDPLAILIMKFLQLFFLLAPNHFTFRMIKLATLK